jgi:predicted GNAT superfamily acetyltransferase
MTGRLPGGASSAETLWRLNQQDCVAALQLPCADFVELLQACHLRLEDTAEGALRAFALGMSSHLPQAHFSLHWFLMRFENFLFLERLVVAPALRRKGLASALLERTLQWSRNEGLTMLCCQVHDRPANREAQAFVLSQGFKAIESVMLPSRDIVTMYQRSTATATP